VLTGIYSVDGRWPKSLCGVENLKSIVAERQNSGGLQAINDLYLKTAATPANPYGFPLPQPSLAGTVIPTPVNMAPGGADRTPSYKTPSAVDYQNELGRTLIVLSLLRSVPANAKMLAQLPADAFIAPPPPAPPAPQPPPVPPNLPAIPVDGWGNPMIYVPPAGIGGIYITGSDGLAVPTTITSKDHKGFWVSGGPDGFIGGFNDANGNGTVEAGEIPYGDDNIYSFEN